MPSKPPSTQKQKSPPTLREVFAANSAWARVHLHMPAGEFYALTPLEFDAIFNEYKAKQKRDDSWMAKLCYVVATSAGAKLASGKAIPIDYFAPWYVAPKRKERQGDPIKQLMALLPADRIVDLRKKKHGK
jgi:hypothetical protein